MSYKKTLIIFFSFIIAGAGAYSLIRAGFYPVAIVNWHFISDQSFEKDYAAALRYFQNAVKTYNTDPKILDKPESQKEIRLASLNRLITNELVSEELQNRLGNNLGPITDKLVNQALARPNLAQAVQQIYGLPIEDFKNDILTVEAHKEILQASLAANKGNYDDWLRNAAKSAQVIILYPGIVWNGAGAVAK